MKASIIPPEGNAKLGRSCYDFNELGYPQVPPNREKKCCGIPLTRNTSKVLQHLEVTGALIFIENPTLKHSKRMKIPGIVKHNLQKKKESQQLELSFWFVEMLKDFQPNFLNVGCGRRPIPQRLTTPVQSVATCWRRS